jgi:hypothetical protein
MTSSPDAVLQSLVDRTCDVVLFGGAVELPIGLGTLIIDVMAMTQIGDRSRVERRLLGEFHSRLDRRLRSAIEDDIAAERWRALLVGLGQIFPILH